jgi:hypothetical protein
MSDNSYQEALEDARAEMAKLLHDRASLGSRLSQLDSRLNQLNSTIELLSGLVNEAPKPEAVLSPEMLEGMGISDAIRRVLRDANVGLAPSQIKNKLIESGFELAKYANSAAVIYNTLKRLELQKEIVTVRDSSGAITYTVAPSFADQLGSRLLDQLTLVASPPAPGSLAAQYPNVRSAQALENFKKANKKRMGIT